MDVTLGLDDQTAAQLKMLSEATGFAPEYAAIYAIRLVGACMREGLLFNTPACLWPQEAQMLSSSAGNVLSFADAQQGERRA